MRAIYPASKVRHAPMWRELAKRYPIEATWIDYPEPEDDLGFATLWVACIHEASRSNVVLYCEPGDVLKGALVEVGACLGGGGKVFVVGDVEPLKTARFHPRVKVFPLECLEEALREASFNLVRPGREPKE